MLPIMGPSIFRFRMARQRRRWKKARAFMKQMIVRVEGSRAEIVHRIRNAGLLPTEFAAWVLTVMAPGGVAVNRLPAARNSSGASGSFKPAGHVAVHRPIGCAMDVPSKIPGAPPGFHHAIPTESRPLQPAQLGSILSQRRSVRQELPRGSGGPVSGFRLFVRDLHESRDAGTRDARSGLPGIARRMGRARGAVDLVPRRGAFSLDGRGAG